MKNPPTKASFIKTALFAFFVPFLLAGQALAATITWDSAPSTANVSDLTQISTTGTLFFAATDYVTNAVVNGVTFQTFGTNSKFTPGGTHYTGYFTPTSEYTKLVTNGTFVTTATGPTSPSVISGLTVGNQYKIQIWVPIWNGDWPTQFGTNSSGTNNSPTLHNSVSPATTTQYICGTFTANATTQNLYLFPMAGAGSYAGISAVQVRDVTPAPLAFTGTAIGTATGSHSYNSGTGTLTVTGNGNGVWTGGAGFHPDSDYFAYSTATYTGDVEIVARLVSVTFPDASNGQAGLMIRQSNSTNEINRAATYFVPDYNGLGHSKAYIGSGPPMDGQIDYFNSGTYYPEPALNPPYWLKLVRVGNNFGTYWSLDGRDWILLSGNSGGALFGTGAFNVGLFVDSFFGSGSTSAVFDNIYIGAPRLKYKTSWIGATSVGVADGNVSNQVYSMWVKPDDGACYTNGNWDEGGETGKIYKDGKVFHRFLGPGINGAHEGTVTGNGSNIFYYNCLPTPGVWRSDFTTANPVQLTFTGTPLGEVRGLAASSDTLFVSDYGNGLLRRVSLASGAEIGTPIPLPRCGPSTFDGTNFWVIQAATQDIAGTALSTHTVGTFTPTIRCFAPNGTEVTPSRTITWTDGGIPTAIAYQDLGTLNATDSSDVLWVCDNGPHQYIRKYNNLTGTPAVMTPFGQDGGLWQKDPAGNPIGHPGQITDPAYGGDKRFYGPVGVGTDSGGNIYVACNGGTGHVTDIRKFNSAGTLQWRVNGLAFLHNGDFDPDPAKDGQEYYFPDKHFTLNYANTAPGSEWSYTGYTRNITKNANEGRNEIAPLTANLCGVRLARVGSGSPAPLYMYTSGQGDMKASWLYYFNGETAVPFGYNWHDFGAGAIHRVWFDANNNQTVDAGEETTLPNPGGTATAFDVDSSGDIWVNFSGSRIRRLVNLGIQTIGTSPNTAVVPKYSLTAPGGYIDYAVPAPLTVVWNLSYDSKNDVLYAVGKKADNTWALVRCDQWKNNPKNPYGSPATWSVNLTPQTDITILFPPPEVNWTYNGLDVAGDKIFVAEVYGPIHVYDAAMGNPILQLIQGPEVSARFGWDDMVMGISACKRSTGEYLVTEEGAGWNASVLLYRWTPTVDTTVPGATTQLTATPQGHAIALGWTGPLGTVTSYNIYRGTTSGSLTLYQSNVTAASFVDTNVTPGTTYYYTVAAVSAVGTGAQSNQASAAAASAQADFVKYDTTTKGDWYTGTSPTVSYVYGSEGYWISGNPSDSVSLPSAYVQSLTPPASRYVWFFDPAQNTTTHNYTTDVRGVRYPTGTARTSASDIANSSETWDIVFKDTQWHQISLYLANWGNDTTQMAVLILDKTTGAVLDSQNPMSLANGKWAVWNVRGNVTIKVTAAGGGSTAVLSGIFFDPVQTTAVPALGWWKLDDTTGTLATDSSGAGNNATKTGGTWNASGKINGCVTYGGTSTTSNLALTAFNPPNAPRITYATWFKTSTNGVILGMWNAGTPPTAFAPVLYVGTDNKLHGAFHTGAIRTVASSASVNDGQWHHAALTSDGKLQTLYLDGEVAGSLSAPVSSLTSASYSFVGGQGYVTGWPSLTGTQAYFNGQVDDIRLYNRVLSNSEIWKLAH